MFYKSLTNRFAKMCYSLAFYVPLLTGDHWFESRPATRRLSPRVHLIYLAYLAHLVLRTDIQMLIIKSF